jgi:hypothetical protein
LTPLLIPVIEMVRLVPIADSVLETLTSDESDKEPDPITVSPTLIETSPAVPLNPPKDAMTSLNFTLEVMLIEKVMDEAGLLLDPIWE